MKRKQNEDAKRRKVIEQLKEQLGIDEAIVQRAVSLGKPVNVEDVKRKLNPTIVKLLVRHGRAS